MSLQGCLLSAQFQASVYSFQRKDQKPTRSSNTTRLGMCWLVLVLSPLSSTLSCYRTRRATQILQAASHLSRKAKSTLRFNVTANAIDLESWLQHHESCPTSSNPAPPIQPLPDPSLHQRLSWRNIPHAPVAIGRHLAEQHTPSVHFAVLVLFVFCFRWFALPLHGMHLRMPDYFLL